MSKQPKHIKFKKDRRLRISDGGIVWMHGMYIMRQGDKLIFDIETLGPYEW